MDCDLQAWTNKFNDIMQEKLRYTNESIADMTEQIKIMEAKM